MSWIYGRVARQRRARYRTGGAPVRRLRQPVVSIGNLAVGGTGKTPLVAHVVEGLLGAGERPAVLTRGYGREVDEEGVVVVRTAERLCADVARAGDEPFMLARRLDGAVVLVSADRYLAGRLAEARLGCTVHVLDDGFQHVQLARDLDIVVVRADDVDRGALLPEGRLREPLDTLAQADALVLADGTLEEARLIAARFGVAEAFATTRVPGVARLVEPWGQAPRVPRDAPILACAAIARPQRLFDDLRARGWNLAGTMTWRDHHRFTAADVSRIAAERVRLQAELVVTTEKDVVRLLPRRPLPFPVAWVPLALEIDPPDTLVDVVRASIAHARVRTADAGW